MSEWISVKDRLPDYGVVVLVWGCDELPITAFRLLNPDSNEWTWMDYQDVTDPCGYVGVTHWMTLPKEPTK